MVLPADYPGISKQLMSALDLARPPIAVIFGAEAASRLPRYSGRVVEIDKKRQILILVRDGKVQWIFNTSTGTEKPYRYKGKRYMADTPKGKWRVFRQVKGWRDGELGHLFNPKYFHNDGIAIHGYTSVPPFPASHGCARITLDASRFLWKKIPIGTRVWIY